MIFLDYTLCAKSKYALIRFIVFVLHQFLQLIENADIYCQVPRFQKLCGQRFALVFSHNRQKLREVSCSEHLQEVDELVLMIVKVLECSVFFCGRCFFNLMNNYLYYICYRFTCTQDRLHFRFISLFRLMLQCLPCFFLQTRLLHMTVCTV